MRDLKIWGCSIVSAILLVLAGHYDNPLGMLLGVIGALLLGIITITACAQKMDIERVHEIREILRRANENRNIR